MFGTVARIHVKPGMQEELARVMAEDDLVAIPGWIADYLFQSTGDPSECYLVAFFQDEESYKANAGSPEQHARYLKFRACLDKDPEWHDGYVISATGPGAAIS